MLLEVSHAEWLSNSIPTTTRQTTRTTALISRDYIDAGHPAHNVEF